MKKSTKHFLIGAGVATAGAAVLGAIHHYTTKYLMKLALDREGPKSTAKEKEKMMSSGDMSETVAAIMNATQKLETTEHEQVEITAQDGTCLIGHWYCPENAKRIIVAMHGWRSNWSQDFGMIAPFWLDNDCAVLFAEQRGQGNSGGEYMGFGLLERYDCLDWINWVNERTEGKLPIYLGGVSMGATTILMTAGFELPENVRGIVADCKVPVLFIHGTDDNFVPVEMTYENYKACASDKRLFIVPGAEHGMSYLVDKEGYETAVKKFWRQYDVSEQY